MKKVNARMEMIMIEMCGLGVSLPQLFFHSLRKAWVSIDIAGIASRLIGDSVSQKLRVTAATAMIAP